MKYIWFFFGYKKVSLIDFVLAQLNENFFFFFFSLTENYTTLASNLQLWHKLFDTEQGLR